MEAAKAGFDWIVFDVSTLPLEENIRQTRTAVETLKALVAARLALFSSSAAKRPNSMSRVF
jgi:fructose-bisphosphate aldolase class II